MLWKPMSAMSDSSSTACSAVIANHTRALWLSRLGSGLRSALACVAVAYATLYSPSALRHRLSFPAFSYVTAILIVGEATLGDALHGAVDALYATILGALPAFLCLFLVGQHASCSIATTSLVVALSSFAVAILESTSLITKRIALGQIVLVYVAAYKQYGHTKAFLHPVDVAASTAVGATAAVLALVFPYPRLAFYEVREKRKLYTDIALERLRLLVSAFCADNDSSAVMLISQESSLTAASAKLLHCIKLRQTTLHWERPPFLVPAVRGLSNKLQSIDMTLKGMEIALSSTSLFPIKALNKQLTDQVHVFRDQTCLSLKQYSYVAAKDNINKGLQSLNVMPQNQQDLAACFFLFCMKFLHDGPLVDASRSAAAQEKKVTPTAEQTESSCKEERQKRKICWVMRIVSKERLLIALKCSISLGLAILFGVQYSRDYGYWAALSAALTITPWRESTFSMANVRIQGTVLGSVYGVLGSIISENLMEIRLLSLLPFIVFASFLRHGRIYRKAGGITATISAVIILGRKNDGPPSTFAIGRLMGIFIGLLCSTGVELLLQPTRASTSARQQLEKALQCLNDCVESIELQTHASTKSPLRRKEKKLREQVNKLKRHIGEAEEEPNFYFLPFPSVCYSKLQSSLSTIVDLIYFMVRAMELLAQEFNALGSAWEESKETIIEDMEQFRNSVGVSIRWIEESIQAKSVKKNFTDLEMGKLGARGVLGENEDECRNVIATYIEHAREIMEKLDDVAGGVLKIQAGLSLATIGFCFGKMMSETREMEKRLFELVQSENPSLHFNFV